jgi:hypothetical protein
VLPITAAALVALHVTIAEESLVRAENCITAARAPSILLAIAASNLFSGKLLTGKLNASLASLLNLCARHSSLHESVERKRAGCSM